MGRRFEFSRLVVARLAPLRVCAGPGGQTPYATVREEAAGEGRRRVVVTLWDRTEWRATEGARAIFRMLNGWLPPRRFGKLTAAVGAPAEAAGGLWRCAVTATGLEAL
nr:MAG TPA: hypothetical protein [Caudoviricetes sp.]